MIDADRSRAIGPSAGVDQQAPPACGEGWSGKDHHGANIEVITASHGWPIYTCPVRPGREPETTCARTHPGLLDALEAVDTCYGGAGVPLGHLGYKGQRYRLVLAVEKVKATALSVEQVCCNALHSVTRALAERANALKVTFAVLGQVSINPRRIGAMTAALLVLHTEHHHAA